MKLAPEISPNKTVEGLLGGIAVGVLLGVAFAAALVPDMPPGRAAFLAFLLTLAAALGDLTVSLLKRSAGVKDAGRLLPGHGGLLDRLSGLLWASPLLHLLLSARGASP
jgi:phosphatidate cytidylyltransferase